MPPRHFEAIIFSAKAAAAAFFAVMCYIFSNLPGAVWAAISAVLVTQTSLHSSWKASLTRVIANLVGAIWRRGVESRHRPPAVGDGHRRHVHWPCLLYSKGR